MIRKNEEREIRRLIERLAMSEKKLDNLLSKSNDSEIAHQKNQEGNNFDNSLTFETSKIPKFILSRTEIIPALVNEPSPSDAKKQSINLTYRPLIAVLSIMVSGISTVILSYTLFDSLYYSVTLFTQLLLLSPIVFPSLLLFYAVNPQIFSNCARLNFFTRLVLSFFIPGSGLLLKGKSFHGTLFYSFSLLFLSIYILFGSDFFSPRSFPLNLKEPLFFLYNISLAGLIFTYFFNLLYTYTDSVKPRFSPFRFILLILLLLASIELFIYSDSQIYISQIDGISYFAKEQDLKITYKFIDNFRRFLQFISVTL